jgi:hypothetical protein
MMMSRLLVITSFAVLLASCSTPSANQNGWTNARLACTDVGITPGSDVFDRCVFNLYYSVWDAEYTPRQTQ